MIDLLSDDNVQVESTKIKNPEPLFNYCILLTQRRDELLLPEVLNPMPLRDRLLVKLTFLQKKY